MLKHINLLLFTVVLTVLSAVSSFSQYAVKVVSPNGGEKLHVGTEVEITWEGIQPYQEVSLDYSTDNGATWKNIYGFATGLKYNWTVPNDASSQCLIRATVVDPISPAQWVKKATGIDGNEFPMGLGSDRQGNIFVCGAIQSSKIDFGLGEISNSNATQGLFLAKYNEDGGILWVKTISGKNISVSAGTVVIDTLGNLFIHGNLSPDTLDFGNGILLSLGGTLNNNSRATFLVKYDTDGNALWGKKLNIASGFQQSLTYDTTGHLYICGGFRGDTADLGNGVIVIDSTEDRRSSNGIIAKLDLNGNALWARQISSPYGNDHEGISPSVIITDGVGNITISGHFSTKSANFGDGFIITNSSPGSVLKGDLFTARYSSNGKILWVKKAVGAKLKNYEPIIVESIAHDFFQNVYICGYYDSKTVDFGNGHLLSNSGIASDGFIAKYDVLGNIVWAKSVGGDTADGIYSIATDAFGELYVTGSTFSSTLDFGSNVIMRSKRANYFEFFVAKYDTNGNAQWYKRTVGNSYESGTAITVDAAKNIIVTGYSASTQLNFGNNLLEKTDDKKTDLFVAKYTSDAPFGVSDISDNTWTIDKPDFSALNIDMGKVLLGMQKDSLITTFIRNEGTLPVDVRDIQLSGAQASEFTIVSGKPPFIIPIGGVGTVEFRFVPAAIGIRQANLMVVTPIDNLYQIIQGEGVQPLINIAASLVDMGVVEIGSQKDTTLTAIVENIGSAPLKITGTTLSGSDKNAYTLVNSPGSFIMEAGSKQTIELRFSPQAIGQTSAELQFEYEGMTSGPAIARITGIGIGGSMSVENDSAYAGESRFLKIKLNKHTAHDIQQQKPVSFKASISYGNSIIAPALNTTGVTVANNNETGIVEIASQWNGSSTELMAIPFTATLGDRTETPLELLSFQWLNDAGEIINSDTELQSGTFTMLGICEEGGTRLYDVNGKAQMMMLAPHPANGVVEITFETVERGATKLMVTDVLGQQIVLKEGSFEKGSHSFEFDAEGLTNGMYILTMLTPTQVFTQRVIIGK